MKWGLVPGWAKDDKIAYSTFNARSEELADKPACEIASNNDPLRGGFRVQF